MTKTPIEPATDETIDLKARLRPWTVVAEPALFEVAPLYLEALEATGERCPDRVPDSQTCQGCPAPLGDPTMTDEALTATAARLAVAVSDRPVIYVAGYYTASPTHGTANAIRAAEELLSLGWVPLVPHVSLLLDIFSPHEPEFWYEYDMALLKRCDALYVCTDPMSADSEGVEREIACALREGIPVYLDPVGPPR